MGLRKVERVSAGLRNARGAGARAFIHDCGIVQSLPVGNGLGVRQGQRADNKQADTTHLADRQQHCFRGRQVALRQALQYVRERDFADDDVALGQADELGIWLIRHLALVVSVSQLRLHSGTQLQTSAPA